MSQWRLGRTVGMKLPSVGGTLAPKWLNGIPRSWGGRAAEERREIGERELCWRWLGIYLLCSLLIKPAHSAAGAGLVNTQADSLVSDHLLPGLRPGWGRGGQ